MTTLLVIVAIGAALLAGGVVFAGRVGLLHGTPPSDLGIHDGHLKAPSRTPNSVSSQAGQHAGHPQQTTAQIEPLALRGDGAATMTRLATLIERMPGARLVVRQPDYLYAQFTTPLLRFVDDVELWFDPASDRVQLRSASRLGHGDLGANRKRIEALRAALAQMP